MPGDRRVLGRAEAARRRDAERFGPLADRARAPPTPPSPITGISGACRSGRSRDGRAGCEEVRRALPRRQHRLRASPRARGPDPTRRSGGSVRRRCTGISSAASIPMPWPTGAPTSVGGPAGWIAPSWRISAPIVRCECITPFGSDVVPDVYAISAGARRIDGRGLVDRLVVDEVGERGGAGRGRRRRPRPIRGRAGRAHRVEVGDEVEVPERVGGDRTPSPRARAGCTTLPSAP